MAIYNKTIKNSNGITYTKEVDGPSDWYGIQNNTYFKDLSDDLIYWKDNAGIVIAIYERNLCTTGSTLIGSVVYFDRNDSLSAYTLDLSSLDVNDTFITGMTFNPSTYEIIATRNDGFSTSPIDLSILSADVNVTGGTYDINTGVVTFTNNSGGTFNVSGFTSGMTDSYTVAANISGNSITFDSNLNGPNFYNVDLTPILSGITLTSGNGITIGTGNTINLGGLLTQSTTISGNSQTFDLGVTGSELSFLRIKSLQAQENYTSGGVGLQVNKTPSGFFSEIDYTSVTGFKSEIQQNPNNISTIVSSNSGNTTSTIIQTPGIINLLTNTDESTLSDSGLILDQSVDSFRFVDNRLAHRGLEYDADYSTGYTSLSLITKGDLDNAISGITDNNYYTTGATLINDIVYFDRNDSLSAYTVDLSSLNDGLWSGSTGTNSLTPINQTGNVAYGTDSLAGGNNSIASGTTSFAYGTQVSALNDYSVAFGLQNTASGQLSTAFGVQNTASGQLSTAFGLQNTVIGARSTAFGGSGVVSGNDSVAFGSGNAIYGNSSITCGGANVITGNNSAGFGGQINVSGNNSIAAGSSASASGGASAAFGGLTSASGTQSFAAGGSTIASGNQSTAFGLQNFAIGDNSHAGGNFSTASGTTSFAHSFLSSANATNSAILGGSGSTLTETAVNSVILGCENLTGTSANTVYACNIDAGTYYSGGTNLLDIFSGSTDYYTTGTTLIGNTIYFDRNDTLSAYTADLSSIIPTDTNFANTDLTLTGNRTHDLSGNTLSINQNSQTRFGINTFGDVLFGRGSLNNLNVVIGDEAGRGVDNAGNVLIGPRAGKDLVIGAGNTVVGAYAGTSGEFGNCAYFGDLAGQTVSGGFANVFIGSQAGRYFGPSLTNLTTSDNSILIGHQASPLSNGSTNEIVIGGGSIGYGNNTTLLGSISTTLTRLRGRVEMDTVNSQPTITDNNSYAIWFNSGVPTIRLKDSLGVESNIVLGGGTDTNFANTNLTLTGNRTHTLGANTLNIGSGLSLTNSLLALTARQTLTTSGNDDSLNINHSSGSGLGLSITKGGNGEGLFVNKTSGSGNAATIQGGVLSLTNQKIVDVTDPTAAQDAATKNYVDTNFQLSSSAITKTSGVFNRTLTLQAPTSSDDITIFRTDVAITVQEVIAVSIGTTPSTTYQLKHSTDRDAAGSNLTTSAATTSKTTGDVATLSVAAIPANSWVWLETTAASGTDVILTVDIRYTID